MGLFKRAKSIIKDNSRSKNDDTKDRNQLLRELKSKVDTLYTKRLRIDRQIVEQVTIIEKLKKYIDKTNDLKIAQTAKHQLEETERQYQQLQKDKEIIQQHIFEFDATYARLSEQIDQMNQLELEWKSNQTSQSEGLDYQEEKLRRELAELEALSELRKNTLDR